MKYEYIIQYRKAFDTIWSDFLMDRLPVKQMPFNTLEGS